MSPNEERGGAPPYEVCTPGLLAAGQLAVVETIHRRFLESLARRLSDILETAVTAELGGIEQMQFAEFLDSCDSAACLIPLSAEAGVSRGILELTPGFLHEVLALLIGAPENAVRPQRAITGIERHILREYTDGLASDLRETWASYGVNLEPASIAENDGPARPSIPDCAAVIVTSVVHLGAAQQSIRLAMPALLVRLAAMAMHSPRAAPVPAVQPSLLEALGTASVRVEAILGGPNLRMRDLLALTPGQVLILGPPGNCSVECVVNGVSKFRGELVSSGRNQAFQIGSPVERRNGRSG